MNTYKILVTDDNWHIDEHCYYCYARNVWAVSLPTPGRGTSDIFVCRKCVTKMLEGFKND